ncbi:signal transduction histidine kinase [Paraburkholderia sp. GAS41]
MLSTLSEEITRDLHGEMSNDLSNAALPLQEFLHLAVKIALAVASAHARNLVHGRLTPHNIMILQGRHRVWLTGFHPVLNADIDTLSTADVLESQLEPELLQYIAPEAAGRIDRAIDYRTDLYSLGCIFYRLLAGRVPVPDLTSGENAPVSIGRWPTDHAELSATYPERLVAIIFRLMARQPEERYRSAADVVTDLLTCDAQGAFNAPCAKLARAQSVLDASDLLLHRDHEVAALHRAVLEASMDDSNRLILLEGPAGIGKTAVIRHLRSQLSDVAYEFAMGACQQAERTTPYAGLTRALCYLQRNILGYPPQEFQQIQTRIKDALADDVSTVARVFPALQPSLGVFEPSATFSIQTEKRHFLKTMARLLGAFATRGRPLIVFLDDLQWVDEDTVEVLEYAIRHGANRCVLLIGALQSNETYPKHVQGMAFPSDDWVRRFPLAALSSDAVKTLLKTLLTGNVAQIDELTDVVHAQTGGNPQVVMQLLRFLIDENVLDYDEVSREWRANLVTMAQRQEIAQFAPVMRMPKIEQAPAHPAGEHAFDVRAVLRTAQALSSEICFVKLIRVLLDNALQYAGSDRAVLCLLRDGVLNVTAQATCSRGVVEVNMESGAALAEVLPSSVAYSTLRTKESLVLEDAREDPHHGRDAYIAQYRCRSVLCVPLIKQDTLAGLLYMEHGLTAGIFTTNRIQMLEVLASQAAISLENARLYEDLATENFMRAATESHLRETQEKLDKVAKLTAMGQLVASIVHEVSQPLSAIGTCARAALRWLDRDIPDLKEARGMLEQISADSVRAASIVTSLRAMAKKSQPRLDRMDINEAIREVLGLIQGQLRSAGVVVRGNYGLACLIVRGDRILLQQVLMNLVVNACEAMSEIDGRERIIEIKTRVDKDHTLWTTVSDTGPGIASESALALFESFYTTKDSGMGMGLSICKSIVEAHGGDIVADLTVRSGACFRFSVPQLTGNASSAREM